MASRVDFRVSATPVVSVAAAENMAVDTIARDVQKTLSGSGTVAATFVATNGYTLGVVSYATASDSTWSGELNTMEHPVMCFIKHTGYTSSAFTTATTSTLRIAALRDSDMEQVEFTSLPAGAAIVLPVNVSPLSPYHVYYKVRSTSGDICVEYFFTN